jgi:hypothetical protein
MTDEERLEKKRNDARLYYYSHREESLAKRRATYVPHPRHQLSEDEKEESKRRQKEAIKRWNEAHPEKLLEYARKWREANPEKQAESSKKWKLANPDYKKKWRAANREKTLAQGRKDSLNQRQRNPERTRARDKVKDRIRRGKLARSPVCLSCGITCKTQAHHANGYSKEAALDVVWLCTKCHRSLHVF